MYVNGTVRNLLEETLQCLDENGKTPDDIIWVGCREFRIPVEDFLRIADTEYDSDFGFIEVAQDLIIVGDDWWLSRWEYDGSEGWTFNRRPDMPEEIRAIHHLTFWDGESLEKVNDAEFRRREPSIWCDRECRERYGFE